MTSQKCQKTPSEFVRRHIGPSKEQQTQIDDLKAEVTRLKGFE